ncbi:MAG: hypothetical protein L6R48_17175, partial [Planctomycetes bacterium]|nr:hypothetical protein [Planctomycetota bacterium]
MTAIRSAVLPSLLAAALAAGAGAAETPRSVPASAAATRPAARTEATGNAPAADEWRKVQLAIEADAKEAGAALADITRRYPRWGDGWRAQATWQLRKGLRAEAAASAKSGLAAGDAPCAALLARALVESGRAKEALAVVAVEAERGGDGDGWLSYWGGEAALDLNDLDKARDMVARAQARAGAKVPAWFLLLEARLKLRTKSWAEAEALLERATAARAELLDAWYELGRVRLLRAELEPEGAQARLRQADEAFRTALIGRPGDAGVRLGAARAALGLGRLAAAAGQDTEATSQFRRAAETLEPVLKATPDDRDARLTAGEARLRLGDWATAADHLGRARTLGAKDHSLPFNLAMALQNCGRQAEAAAALQGLSATTPPEQVAVGMGAWSAGDAVLAARMLGDAATALTASDPVNAGACWRFAGHAHRRAADRLGADAGTEREQELDAAAACWAKAGDLKDYEARRFLIAQESARDPVRAYAVAWKQIGWEDGISLAGWRLALANYAGAVTRGQGLAGMAANAPLHLAGWLALVLLPLALFAWALVRRNRTPAAPTAEPGTRATELTTPRP